MSEVSAGLSFRRQPFRPEIAVVVCTGLSSQFLALVRRHGAAICGICAITGEAFAHLRAGDSVRVIFKIHHLLFDAGDIQILVLRIQ